MTVIDGLTLIDIAKLVGITFMALMAFVSLLFSVLSILIYRNNKTEVEAATSDLNNRRQELDDYIVQRSHDIRDELYYAQIDQKIAFEKAISMQMNLSLLEFEAQISNPSDTKVFTLLSRLMNTATSDCTPVVSTIVANKNLSDDVRRHGELLLSEIASRQRYSTGLNHTN